MPRNEKLSVTNEKIFNLIKTGKVDELKEVLKVSNHNLNHEIYGEKIPIHIAVENNNIEIVKYLIEEKKVNMNIRENYNRRTPLHIASERGFLDIVKYLIEKGANINIVDVLTETACQLSIRNKHVDVAKYFIEYFKTNNIINTPDFEGNYYIHIAVSQNSIEIVKLLIENKICNVYMENNYAKTPLIIACEIGSIEIVKYLVEKGSDIDKEYFITYSLSKFNSNPLSISIEKKHTNVVKYLIEKGAEINTPKYTYITPSNLTTNVTKNYIMYFVINNIKYDNENYNSDDDAYYIDILKFLILNNAKVNLDILKYALLKGNSIFKLFEDNYDINNMILEGNKDYIIFLHDLITDNYLFRDEIQRENIIEYITEKYYKTNFNIKNHHNLSSFDLAIQNNRLLIVKYFIQKGVIIDDTSSIFNIIAQFNKFDTSILSYLIENGFDIYFKNNEGYNAVHIACLYTNIKIIKFLFETLSNFEINDKNNQGETALHIMLKIYNYNFINDKNNDIAFNIIKYLLQKGADIHIKNNEGKSPVTLAATLGIEINNLFYGRYTEEQPLRYQRVEDEDRYTEEQPIRLRNGRIQDSGKSLKRKSLKRKSLKRKSLKRKSTKRKSTKKSLKRKLN
jgi:ankyrin repeat protein